MHEMHVVVLSGGTGSVKLARALYRLEQEGSVGRSNCGCSGRSDYKHDERIHLSIVCNVGDNVWMHGLYICPDIDTIVYGLAGVLDRVRGWGIAYDTFNCLAQLALLEGEQWFMLGDRDMAMHIVRSRMLREGRRLCEVTGYVCSKLGINANVLPASDDHVETRMVTDRGEMHLQEFWVRYKGTLDVNGVVYRGVENARACDDALHAVEEADTIIIAPANPVSSILPILAVKELGDAVRRARSRCIAVSPIVGSSPVSGPAAKYMRALGYDVNPVSIACMYREFASRLVIHGTDEHYADTIRGMGVDVYTTDILMDDEHDELRLASYLLSIR
ncbi:MAG: 2-phospho-L-lactate transferase [Candidatus Nitrosocaldus sp.]|nr:2-phospho-L-lactate transferase [Candidatus Nitrosocaldus sp.]MDW8000630.1 2-phospho-L-lactate transferase [Candidatus Nitrosocaldus sp.]